MTLALDIFVVLFAAVLYGYLIYFLAVEPFLIWLRRRHDVKVEPSPLIREIQRWLAARERAMQRAGIVELDGHPRLGLQLDERRGARVLRHRAP